MHDDRTSGNPELAATLHILAAPLFEGRREVEQHIHLKSRGIDFDAMLKAAPWSEGERAMLEAACVMWGREDIADAKLSPILYTLDVENFNRVVEAMCIRRRMARATTDLGRLSERLGLGLVEQPSPRGTAPWEQTSG